MLMVANMCHESIFHKSKYFEQDKTILVIIHSIFVRKLNVRCWFLNAFPISSFQVQFLGVPRLVENYVILNREGDAVQLNTIPDLWLLPFQENLHTKPEEKPSEEGNQSELDFLSSWFSDVYQTDCTNSDRRRPMSMLTDMLEVSKSEERFLCHRYPQYEKHNFSQNTTSYKKLQLITS